MELNELLKYTKRFCHIDKEDDLEIMLKFYHDLGVIVMHGRTVVLQALWLIDLFKQLINVRPYDERVNSDTPHNNNNNNDDDDDDDDNDDDNNNKINLF